MFVKHHKPQNPWISGITSIYWGQPQVSSLSSLVLFGLVSGYKKKTEKWKANRQQKYKVVTIP